MGSFLLSTPPTSQNGHMHGNACQLVRILPFWMLQREARTPGHRYRKGSYMKYLYGRTLLATIALLFIYAVQAHSSELELIATCGPNSLYFEMPRGAVADNSQIHIESDNFSYYSSPSVTTGSIYILKFERFTVRAPFPGGRKEALQRFRFHCNGAGRGGNKVRIKKHTR